MSGAMDRHPMCDAYEAQQDAMASALADAYAAGHAAGFADGLVLGAEAWERERVARDAIWCADWEARLRGEAARRRTP